MGKKSNIKDIYTLTPMQEGMLFHYIMYKIPEENFIQTIYELIGDVNIDILEKSLNRVIERYDVLRTIFIHEGVKQPVQVVLKEKKTSIHYEDISSAADKKKYIENYLEEDRKRGFDLSRDMLIRMAVIKLGEKRYKIILSCHHIIIDGWGISIVIRDLLAVHHALMNNKEAKLPSVYPYSSFIKWIEAQNKEKAENYWGKYLEGYETQTSIPKAYTNRIDRSYRQGVIRKAFSKEETDKLKEIARDNQVTLSTVFQAIWSIILQRYNDTEDVVFGAVVSGRPEEVIGIEEMLGIFINTVPVRMKSNKEERFNELLKRRQENAIESKEFEYYPLVEIQSKSVLKQNLLDHIVIFENYPEEDAIVGYKEETRVGFEISDIQSFEQTYYDLNIIVAVGAISVIKINFNTEVYEWEKIESLCRHIGNVVKAVVEDPEKKLCEIEILDEAEKDKLLYELNDTKAQYFKNAVTGIAYAAAGNEIEESLIGIWQEVLKIERIGINDNFFEIGGHSINALILKNRISAEFGVPCLMSAIFRYPTVKEFAVFLKQQGVSGPKREGDSEA